MSGLTFEGYLDNITQRQLEYIESVIVKLGYNDAKVTVEPVGKVGDNYGAYVRSITVEKNGDTLNMFAKISRGHEKLRETIDIGVYFKNESVIYSEVFPKFTELEIKAGIPESERLTYAKCYGCLNEEPSEVILLEDLKVKGFTMENKCESLSDEAVKLILKNLAALHSLSYVLKAQEPETYKTIISKFTNPWESVQEEDAHYQKMEDGILGVLTDEKYKSHLAGKIFHFTKYMGEINKKRRQCQWAVIIQGDPWTNNFMFQRKDERLVTCCMVDYQLANVNVPASDLGYMIFTCTDHETRMKHYHDWLDYYHSQLTKYLKYHGLEAEQIFSKAQLQEDMKRYGSLSLAQGALVSSIILRESEDAGKMKERIAQAEGEGNVMDTMAEMFKVNQLKEGTVKLFKSRLEGLVDSHLAFGYIE